MKKILIPAIIVIGLIGYTIFWNKKAEIIKESFAQELEQIKISQFDIAYDEISVTGFPFSHKTSIVKPKVIFLPDTNASSFMEYSGNAQLDLADDYLSAKILLPKVASYQSGEGRYDIDFEKQSVINLGLKPVGTSGGRYSIDSFNYEFLGLSTKLTDASDSNVMNIAKGNIAAKINGDNATFKGSRVSYEFNDVRLGNSYLSQLEKGEMIDAAQNEFFKSFYEEIGAFQYKGEFNVETQNKLEGLNPVPTYSLNITEFTVANEKFSVGADGFIEASSKQGALPMGNLRLNFNNYEEILNYYTKYVSHLLGGQFDKDAFFTKYKAMIEKYGKVNDQTVSFELARNAQAKISINEFTVGDLIGDLLRK